MRSPSPVWFLALTCSLAPVARAQVAAAAEVAAPATPVLHGRLEQHAGLRVLRLWGTPEERGYAHGRLMAAEIVHIMGLELSSRFAKQLPVLAELRRATGRLIEYPDDIVAELEALWRGVVDSGVALQVDGLGRELDRTDLIFVNALDIFGLMGCSSFTVWGEQAVGGGVLTARNFDWPLSGAHLIDSTLMVVQHLANGRAVASVAWPGYVGTVTGVSSDGMAAYLHVGSAEITYTPEPSSWPSAIAARAILAAGAAGGPEKVFPAARELLGYTSPPAGYLTHVVLPDASGGGAPVAVFETDADSCVHGENAEPTLVVTNHFRTRADGRGASADSLARFKDVSGGIAGCIEVGDHKVDVDEAWRILASVEFDGSRRFGTLHSIVFRHEPFHFELRVARLDERGRTIGAPSSSARHVLSREQLFGDGTLPGAGR